jgi:hypothetical protein
MPSKATTVDSGSRKGQICRAMPGQQWRTWGGAIRVAALRPFDPTVLKPSAPSTAWPPETRLQKPRNRRVSGVLIFETGFPEWESRVNAAYPLRRPEDLANQRFVASTEHSRLQ